MTRPLRILDDHCTVCGAGCLPDSDEEASTTACVRYGGGIIEMHFGYGSSLDTRYFIGVICDSCAETFIRTAAAPLTSYGALGTPDWPNLIEPPEDTGPDTMSEVEP